jgi:hypothetical protein
MLGPQNFSWINRPEAKEIINFRTSVVGPAKAVSSNVPLNSNVTFQKNTIHYSQGQTNTNFNNPIYFKSP